MDDVTGGVYYYNDQTGEMALRWWEVEEAAETEAVAAFATGLNGDSVDSAEDDPGDSEEE